MCDLPTPAALLQHETLFRSVYSPQDAPKVLFRHIKDCQEVQILGEDPYTPQQLPNNDARLLLQCGMYTRNFDDWDQKIAGDKIWTNLKTFVQECYMHHLNTTSITAGSQGYVQNTFAALTEELDDKEDGVQTVMTQMATLTTHSQILASTAAKTTALVAAAINQLAANQQNMQQQFAAFTMQRNTSYQPSQVVQPPITQFLIPNVASFPTEVRGGGRRGGSRRGGGANFWCTGGRNVCTPFANFVGRGGQGGLPPIGSRGRQGSSMDPFMQQHMQCNVAPMYSNILK
jgi:hypothetical protein